MIATTCKDETSEEIADEVQRWGCSLSELLVESPCQTFRLPGKDGFIGYFIKSGSAVVAGDPVSPKENWVELVEAFQEDCKAKNLNIVYFVVSETFADWMVPKYAPVKIQVGEELNYDPFHNPLEGSKANKLRNKVHHAKNIGLTVGEYLGGDPALEKELEGIIQTWSESRQGPQIYLGDIYLFSKREGRRWFYVKDKDRFYGTALLKRMDSNNGWLLKNNVVLQDAPRGTSELVVISILETLRQENCRYLTYGFVPAESIEDISGLGSISTWIVKKTFDAAKWIFNLNNRKTFWQQFHPKTRKAYVLFSHPGFSLSDVKALMSTLKMSF